MVINMYDNLSYCHSVIPSKADESRHCCSFIAAIFVVFIVAALVFTAIICQYHLRNMLKHAEV